MNDFILLNIEKVILLDEKIKKVLNEIHNLEGNSSYVIINGYANRSNEYIKELYNKLGDFLDKKADIETFLNALSVDELYQTYDYMVTKPIDNLKIAKISYLYELIDKVNNKGREI